MGLFDRDEARRREKQQADAPGYSASDGDALVTLACDPEMPLEKRIDLLTWAFSKTLQGCVLRYIVKWEPKEGFIRFIIGCENQKLPRGNVELSLEEFPGHADVRPVTENLELSTG